MAAVSSGKSALAESTTCLAFVTTVSAAALSALVPFLTTSVFGRACTEVFSVVSEAQYDGLSEVLPHAATPIAAAVSRARPPLIECVISPPPHPDRGRAPVPTAGRSSPSVPRPWPGRRRATPQQAPRRPPPSRRPAQPPSERTRSARRQPTAPPVRPAHGSSGPGRRRQGSPTRAGGGREPPASARRRPRGCGAAPVSRVRRAMPEVGLTALMMEELGLGGGVFLGRDRVALPEVGERVELLDGGRRWRGRGPVGGGLTLRAEIGDVSPQRLHRLPGRDVRELPLGLAQQHVGAEQGEDGEHDDARRRA